MIVCIRNKFNLIQLNVKTAFWVLCSSILVPRGRKQFNSEAIQVFLNFKTQIRIHDHDSPKGRWMTCLCFDTWSLFSYTRTFSCQSSHVKAWRSLFVYGNFLTNENEFYYTKGKKDMYDFPSPEDRLLPPHPYKEVIWHYYVTQYFVRCQKCRPSRNFCVSSSSLKSWEPNGFFVTFWGNLFACLVL